MAREKSQGRPVRESAYASPFVPFIRGSLCPKLKRVTICFALTGFVLVGVGQFAVAQPRISLSSKHIDKIQSVKTGVNRLRIYRKFFSKDSLKQVRKLEKLHRKKWDSLVRVTRKAARLEEIMPNVTSVMPSPDFELAKLLRISDSSLMDRDLNVPSLKTQTAVEDRLKSAYGLSDTEIEAFKKGDTALRARVRDRLRESQNLGSLGLSQGQRKQVEILQSSHGKYSKETLQYVAFLKDSVNRFDSLESVARKQIEVSGKGIESMASESGAMQELQSYSKSFDEQRSLPHLARVFNCGSGATSPSRARLPSQGTLARRLPTRAQRVSHAKH